MADTRPSRRPEYKRQVKLRMVARAPKKLCDCGCGTEIPSIQFSGAPRKYATGHGAIRYQPGDTKKNPAGYVLEYAPDHPTASGGFVLQHRLVWERANGPLAKGLSVHHLNHDPADNRLENLAVLTNPEHRELHHRERWEGQTPCLDPSHLKPTSAWKLTPEQVVAIRRRVADGEMQRAVAADLGLTTTLVSRVWLNKIYRCRICSPGVLVGYARPAVTNEHPRVRQLHNQGLTWPLARRQVTRELAAEPVSGD